MNGNALIICGKCGIIFGCTERFSEWFCVICERLRNRVFQDCPWSSFGGKKKPEISGREIKDDVCYGCKVISQHSKIATAQSP